MSRQKKRKTPPKRPPAYQGNRLLRDWTRIYDQCQREVSHDQPASEPADRRR